MTGAPILRATEPSHVGEARRVAREMATRLGFDETTVGRVAVVVTELATNLVKHARDGEIVLQAMGRASAAAPKLDVVAVDRGPGMRNIRQCFEDGYSTAGSPGTGLGAVARLASRHDLYSRPGQGTVMAATIDPPDGAPDGLALEVAGIARPKPGEDACGDAWAVDPRPGGAAIAVVDGLGHGALAADAAAAAVREFHRSSGRPPAERLDRIHAALRQTRGAAGIVADIDARAGRVCFAGIGNVSGMIESREGIRHMVSLGGILGHTVRRINDYAYPWPAGALFIAHTDGLATVRSLEGYPGLAERAPLVIAGVLYRDLLRGRDDAAVVVARDRRA
jgi:anti-sigma regulatory factor (Ser/Thr protein kinase)